MFRDFIFSLLIGTCDVTFKMWKKGSALLTSMNQLLTQHTEKRFGKNI